MFNYFIISQGFVNESFSIILQGIEYDFIPVFTLSHIIIPSFLSQLSINFHFTITFMFSLSCLKFALINQPQIFTLFQIILSHI
ncbi:hypothetical protein GW891_04120 [bacterium]|nr:hypothetical protein [bacterium]